jgi:hypothetical protein
MWRFDDGEMSLIVTDAVGGVGSGSTVRHGKICGSVSWETVPAPATMQTESSEMFASSTFVGNAEKKNTKQALERMSVSDALISLMGHLSRIAREYIAALRFERAGVGVYLPVDPFLGSVYFCAPKPNLSPSSKPRFIVFELLLSLFSGVRRFESTSLRCSILQEVLDVTRAFLVVFRENKRKQSPSKTIRKSTSQLHVWKKLRGNLRELAEGGSIDLGEAGSAVCDSARDVLCSGIDLLYPTPRCRFGLLVSILDATSSSESRDSSLMQKLLVSVCQSMAILQCHTTAHSFFTTTSKECKKSSGTLQKNDQLQEKPESNNSEDLRSLVPCNSTSFPLNIVDSLLPAAAVQQRPLWSGVVITGKKVLEAKYDEKRSSIGITFSDDGKTAICQGRRSPHYNHALVDVCFSSDASLASRGCTLGNHEWEFEIHDKRGDEMVCIGAALQDVRNSNFQASREMWMYRAYNGDLYDKGNKISHQFPKCHSGDRIRIKYNVSEGTLSFSRNDVDLGIAFRNVFGAVCPAVAFYNTQAPARKIKLRRS